MQAVWSCSSSSWTSRMLSLEEPLTSPCQPMAAAKSQHAMKSSRGSLSSRLTPGDIQGTLAFLFLGKTKMSALVVLAKLEWILTAIKHLLQLCMTAGLNNTRIKNRPLHCQFENVCFDSRWSLLLRNPGGEKTLLVFALWCTSMLALTSANIFEVKTNLSFFPDSFCTEVFHLQSCQYVPVPQPLGKPQSRDVTQELWLSCYTERDGKSLLQIHMLRTGSTQA